MPQYLTKEEVEKEFDEKFRERTCCGNGYVLEYDTNTKHNSWESEDARPFIKSFIHSLRLADKQALYSEINEWVEKNKVLEVSLPSDDARVLLWKQKHNKTLSDLIEFIKSKKE